MAVSPGVGGGGGFGGGQIGQVSGDSPRTDPSLNPQLQITNQQQLEPRTVTIGATGRVQVTANNVSRVAFMVDSRTAAAFRLTMDSEATYTPVVTDRAGVSPILIHSAEFPVYCQGVWYAVGDNGTVLVVWETFLVG